MEEQKKTYTKLGNLVDDQFTITKAWGYTWKKWDNENSKMLMSDEWQEGYQKKYQLDTDKGTLDLGSGQLASLLEAVYKDGKADINGRTFKVKSNGKTGMDIRYFFSAVQGEPQDVVATDVTSDINLDSIPW